MDKLYIDDQFMVETLVVFSHSFYIQVEHSGCSEKLEEINVASPLCGSPFLILLTARVSLLLKIYPPIHLIKKYICATLGVCDGGLGNAQEQRLLLPPWVSRDTEISLPELPILMCF